MKKILFISDSLNYGGVEKSLVDLITFLKKNFEIEIDLFLFDNSGVYINEIKNYVNHFYSFDTEAQAFLGKKKFILRRIVTNCGFFSLFKFFTLIIKIYFNKNFSKNSFSNKYRKIIIDSSLVELPEYDIAIAYSGKHLLYFCDKKVKSKYKFTYIHGDTSFYDVDQYITEYNNMDKIICVSEYCKSQINNHSESFENKSICIYNLIDFNSINLLKKEKVENIFDKNYINAVSVGRLSSEKNYFYLVSLFNKMINKYSNLRLYIIGDGPEKKKIKKFIVENNLQKHIFILGYKKNPYSYMKQSDFYVQPSINEGFCLSIYEAYYLKKVILTNNVADVSKLIKNEVNGFVANDKYEFEKYLEKIIKMFKSKKGVSVLRNNISVLSNRESELKNIKLYGEFL